MEKKYKNWIWIIRTKISITFNQNAFSYVIVNSTNLLAVWSTHTHICFVLWFHKNTPLLNAIFWMESYSK